MSCYLRLRYLRTLPNIQIHSLTLLYPSLPEQIPQDGQEK